MNSVFRASLILFLFLAVPMVPFLVLGEAFENSVNQWLQSEKQTALQLQFLAVVGILASDILLPIPSSAVTTYAGGVMGLTMATLASWLGLTIGSCLGFGLARGLGHPFARRFADPQDIVRIQNIADRFGWMALLLTRPLPILAEACVLLMGTTTLTWRRFLIPIVSGNLVLSLVYAGCGAAIEDSTTLLVVAVCSGAVPLVLALLIRWQLSS